MVAASSFHWKPNGKPESKLESLVQFIWLHRVLLYIALVCTLTFIFQIFDLEPLGGLLD